MTKKHILVPKHSKVSDTEKEKLLKELSIQTKHLPRILKNDAGLAGVDVKPGDIVKIERESPTVGKSVFYRVVIEG